MQAIMETLFDAAYLVTVVTLGCIMVKSAQDRETKLFGWMAVILGCGDAFHLCPGPGRCVPTAWRPTRQHWERANSSRPLQ